MSEIRKVSKDRREPIPQPKIVGAKPTSEIRSTKIVDQSSPAAKVEIQHTDRNKKITVREHSRRAPKKSDPDVRLQLMTREDREAWNAVKTNQWEAQ
jgi:hypothetical protein